MGKSEVRSQNAEVQKLGIAEIRGNNPRVKEARVKENENAELGRAVLTSAF